MDEAALRALAETIGPLDETAMAAARVRLDRLTKPPGSLGRLEAVAVQLAGITGVAAPPVSPAVIVVAAGDHGVTARGVSAYPSSVTAQMVATFLGGRAAVNVLAEAAGARVVVLDVGLAGPAPAEPAPSTGARLVSRRVRNGTADMTAGPAMTRAEALAAIHAGAELARGLVAEGAAIVGLGEMGIGNTTAASAVVSVLAGATPEAVTGPGTGVTAAGRARKLAAIRDAIACNAPDPADPLGVLAAVGGLELAALVGVTLEAAAARVPVVLDGFITGASALVAACLAPGLPPRLIAAHRSPEPGHRVVLERLGAQPLLDLGMRLGEGSGAAVALNLLTAAARVRDGMATFEEAGVDGASA